MRCPLALVILLASLVLLVADVSGCGGVGEGPAVVRIGALEIGQAEVAHWTRAAGRGGVLGRLHGEQRGAPEQRALAYLISSAWLKGEARRDGYTASDEAVEHALSERKEANGSATFEEELNATGQTVQDVKSEIGAELALEAIRQRLARQRIEVTPAQAKSFYTSHPRQFTVPEERTVDLIERLSSSAAARALVNRIGDGSRFTKRALHEKLERELEGQITPDKQKVLDAIFAARVGHVSSPMRLGRGWTVFIVRSVRPAKLTPFAKVRYEVIHFLTARRRRAALASFDRQYTARWTAQTSCRAGYVVQGCRQYSGPIIAEQNPFSES